MLPQGSIFQYGFLGGGQFKKYLKKWSFWAKSGGLFKKNPKNLTFHITCGSIQEWGSIRADTVFLFGFCRPYFTQHIQQLSFTYIIRMKHWFQQNKEYLNKNDKIFFQAIVYLILWIIFNHVQIDRNNALIKVI